MTPSTPRRPASRRQPPPPAAAAIHPCPPPAAAGAGPAADVNADLRADLLASLAALPYAAYARCVALLLARLGYRDVRPAGRDRFRGSNQYSAGRAGAGGYDLTAELPAPAAAARRRPVAVVALKQFGPGTAVYQRQVDEIRGACLRAGAAEALLVTTGPLSPSVRERAAIENAPFAPARLIDGAELAALMAAHRVGVWEEPGATADEPARLGVDAPFFAALRRAAPGGTAAGAGGARVSPPAAPRASRRPKPSPRRGAPRTHGTAAAGPRKPSRSPAAGAPPPALLRIRVWVRARRA